jgi:hypothetical protein
VVRLHVARCKVLIPLAHANQTHSLHSLTHLAQLNQTRATALYRLAVAGLSMARRPGYGEARNQIRPVSGWREWLLLRFRSGWQRAEPAHGSFQRDRDEAVVARRPSPVLAAGADKEAEQRTRVRAAACVHRPSSRRPGATRKVPFDLRWDFSWINLSPAVCLGLSVSSSRRNGSSF